jgi:H+/Cl- antiporter ClcA
MSPYFLRTPCCPFAFDRVPYQGYLAAGIVLVGYRTVLIGRLALCRFSSCCISHFSLAGSFSAVSLHSTSHSSHWPAGSASHSSHWPAGSLQFLFTPIAVALPVPAGVFVPVFTMGATFGRLVGEIMLAWFPNGIHVLDKQSNIVPGGYAVVGMSIYHLDLTGPWSAHGFLSVPVGSVSQIQLESVAWNIAYWASGHRIHGAILRRERVSKTTSTPIHVSKPNGFALRALLRACLLQTITVNMLMSSITYNDRRGSSGRERDPHCVHVGDCL